MTVPVDTGLRAADRVLEEIWCGPVHDEREAALVELAAIIGRKIGSASPDDIRRIGAYVAGKSARC